MSLPPTLLQRLAQRGLINKQKQKRNESAAVAALEAENEEVIAEDYDEINTSDQHQSEEYQNPSWYDSAGDTVQKRPEDNFWLERIRARLGDSVSTTGYKGCPNKYNIWHKCTVYCVKRWADGQSEPNHNYKRRFQRLLRKYPGPKGWVEVYDPGCGCFYFCNAGDNLVSWLPPTHPKSQVTKCAAYYRRQLEETNCERNSEDEHFTDDENEAEEIGGGRHQQEIDDIINSTMSMQSAQPPPTKHDTTALSESKNNVNRAGPSFRNQKTPESERMSMRRRDREKERDRGYSHSMRRHARNKDADVVDPMDPSAYSDLPRGKWSDGLHTGVNERKKAAESGDECGLERGTGTSTGRRERRDDRSDDETKH